MNDQNSLSETKIFAKKYLAKHLSVEIDEIESLSIDHPDESGILVFNGKRYALKTSNPVSIAKDKKGLVWDFDLRGNQWMNGRNVKTKKDSPTCDFYLLLGLTNDVPEKVFLMASVEVPSSHVRISLTGNSKYYQYAI